jgi:hypothetical protein
MLWAPMSMRSRSTALHLVHSHSVADSRRESNTDWTFVHSKVEMLQQGNCMNRCRSLSPYMASGHTNLPPCSLMTSSARNGRHFSAS